MTACGQLLLDTRGRTAAVRPGEKVVTVGKDAIPLLEKTELLVIPAEVREFHGLNHFQNLRVVRCESEADVFDFQDGLCWLAEKGDDTYPFLNRIATNLLAFRPIAETLTAIIAPRMVPIHALDGWQRLLGLLEDRISPLSGFYRQDDSRQNAILCNSYTQIKRLEYVFDLGYAVARKTYVPSIAAYYLPENQMTGREQILYVLSLMQGHSYREFYSITGEHGYGHLKTKENYMEYLQAVPVWKDTEAFNRILKRMLDLQMIAPENQQAALDLLLEHHMTEATALLLEHGGHCPESSGAAKPSAGSDALSFLDEEFRL